MPQPVKYLGALEQIIVKNKAEERGKKGWGGAGVKNFKFQALLVVWSDIMVSMALKGLMAEEATHKGGQQVKVPLTWGQPWGQARGGTGRGAGGNRFGGRRFGVRVHCFLLILLIFLRAWWSVIQMGDLVHALLQFCRLAILCLSNKSTRIAYAFLTRLFLFFFS